MRNILTSLMILIVVTVRSQSIVSNISPSTNTEFCPFTEHTFTITFSQGNLPANFNISFLDGASIVTGSIQNNGQNKTFRVNFESQSQKQPTLQVRNSQNAIVSETKYIFIKNLKGRVPRINQNLTVPLCQNFVIDLSFSKMRYVKAGGNSNNPSDLFNTPINLYEYIIPTGYSVVGGTVVSTSSPFGTPNAIIGFNDIIVQTNFANPGTIRIRALGEGCNPNLVNFTSDYSDINISRPVLDLKTPNGSKSIQIRCGETDVKTFTVQNGVANSCITYTWQIANKGWRYNGVIPTSNIVTTQPTIDLVSSDDNANPPQSFNVSINVGGVIVNSSITVEYRIPQISLSIPSIQPIECNDQNINANISNAPINSYSLLWNVNSGHTINSQITPLSNIGTSVTVNKITNTSANVSASLVASCGIITANSPSPFEGCTNWDDFLVNFFYPPISIGDELRAIVNGPSNFSAYEYDWFGYNGSTYEQITNTYTPSIQMSYYPCSDNLSIFIRAKGHGITTPLMYVGSYTPDCGFRLMSASSLTVFPNPTQDFINVEYITKNKNYEIIISDWYGKKMMKINTNNKSNRINLKELGKGKFVVMIKDGNQIKSKQIEIK
jgi:hypothetical protein